MNTEKGEQMVFRPNVALRILLWIFIIAVEQLSLISGAEAAKKHPTQTNKPDVQTEITDLQNFLKAEKERIDLLVTTSNKLSDDLQAHPRISDEQKTYLDRVESLRAKFQGMEVDLANTAEHLSGTEMNVSYHYFTIFGLMVALAGVVGTLASVIIKRVVSDTVKKDVDKQIQTSADRVEKEMKARALFETDLARAETLFLLSFTWWEHCEEGFQKFLQNKKTAPAATSPKVPKHILREIGMAKKLSDSGLTIVNGSSFRDASEADGRAWITRARLVNLWVYNTAAELLCHNGIADTAIKSQVLEFADTLIEFAKDKQTGKELWYNFLETAAFAMTNIGNQGTQERGMTLVRDLCANKRPGNDFEQPPSEWLTQLRSEFGIL